MLLAVNNGACIYAGVMKRALPNFTLASAALVACASILTAPSHAQPKQEFVWPERISNAQVLPADIGSARLRLTMVSFARALGVRCTFCHVGAEGAPLDQLDFVSDANPHKNVARGMIRMTRSLNSEALPAILGPAPPDQSRVTCYTCHRGGLAPTPRQRRRGLLRRSRTASAAVPRLNRKIAPLLLRMLGAYKVHDFPRTYCTEFPSGMAVFPKVRR